MKKKKEMAGLLNRLILYRNLVETNGLELKGASMPYTSYQGNMFSFWSHDGILNLRLPEQVRKDFITKYKTRPSEQHGTVLKEYVVVPHSLLKNTKALQKYFDLSYTYVKTLKPKGSKK